MEIVGFGFLQTIIVPMEQPQKKVVVESKVKGPKRLGQGVRGIGIGKKKNHQTLDSEDVEEQTGKDLKYVKY